MDKKEILKKEISELEAEARIARNKNLDAKKDASNIHKEKVALIGEITTLKKEATLEREKHKKLVVKREAVEKDIKVQEKTFVIEEGKLKKERKSLEWLEGNLEGVKESLTTRQANLTQNEARFKGAKTIFQVDKNTHNKEKEAFKQERLAFEKERESVALFSVGLKEKENAITASQNETIENLNKAKSLKALVEQKVKDAEAKEVSLKKATENLNLETKRLQDDEKAFALKEEELNKEKAKLEAKRNGLNRAYSDLDIKKAEIETLNLRVQKLIRDKDIKQELAKLQKDLAK